MNTFTFQLEDFSRFIYIHVAVNIICAKKKKKKGNIIYFLIRIGELYPSSPKTYVWSDMMTYKAMSVWYGVSSMIQHVFSPPCLSFTVSMFIHSSSSSHHCVWLEYHRDKVKVRIGVRVWTKDMVEHWPGIIALKTLCWLTKSHDSVFGLTL